MPRGSLDLAPRPLLPRLERELLAQLAAGHTLRECAPILNYSYAYLKEVRASACQHLGARTTYQALAAAVRQGLI